MATNVYATHRLTFLTVQVNEVMQYLQSLNKTFSVYHQSNLTVTLQIEANYTELNPLIEFCDLQAIPFSRVCLDLAILYEDVRYDSDGNKHTQDVYQEMPPHVVDSFTNQYAYSRRHLLKRILDS